MNQDFLLTTTITHLFQKEIFVQKDKTSKSHRGLLKEIFFKKKPLKHFKT